MKSFALAGRYARALIDLVRESDAKNIEAVGAELDLLAKSVGGELALSAFFDSPSVRRADKDKALKTLGEKAGLSDLTRRFLAVLVDNGRMGSIGAIARAYGALSDEALGIVPAETTVAVKLRDGEQASLRAALEKVTGRSVRLSVKIDPAVLGGASTRVGSVVYDGTLRTRLEALHRRMADAQ